MSGYADNRRVASKPYVIAKEEDGAWSLTCRDTRYNGQGYPIVTETRVEEKFKTANAARAHAAEKFGAQPGEFSRK
jgi:hypothetical protein